MSKILVILFVLMAGTILSQKTIVEYYEYSIENGLVDNWVNDFEMDPNGFVWIATNDGISRFDGYSFINFSSENQALIQRNSSFQDLQLHGEWMYAISSNKGIYTINTKTLQVNQIDKNGVLSYDKLGNQTLIYYSSGLLVLKEGNSIICQKQFAKPETNGKCILTSDKIILNNSFSSIFILDKKMNVLAHPSLTDYSFGISLVRHPKLGVYYSTNKGYFRLEGNKFRALVTQYPENKLSFFNLTQEGKPFYILNFKEPFMPKNDSNYCFIFDKIKNIEVRTIFHLEKDFWLIGTNQGFYKLNVGNRFNEQINDDLFENDEIRVRRKIIENNKQLYLLGFPGIVRFDLSTNTQAFLTKNEKKLTNYDAIKIGENILATSEGIGLWNLNLKKNNLTRITSKFINDKSFFHCIYNENNNSDLLLGGSGEIVRFNHKTMESERFTFNKDLYVFDFEYLRKENEYLIATNKGLFSIKLSKKITNGRNSTLKLIRKSSLSIMVKDILYSSKQQNFWLATDEGIYKMNENANFVIKKYVTKNEISNPKVTGLVEDNQGRIWASTYSGITCYDLKTGKIYLINKKHGLLNTEYNYKSFEKLIDGRIVFGGLFGYDIVNPDLFDFEASKAKIILTGYRRENQNQRTDFNIIQNPIIQFNTGKEDLLLYFSTSDFNQAETYSMDFRINNNKWEALTNENILRLSNLKAGTNKLSIRLKDSFGNICDVKNYLINANIPFYQEIYFYLVLSFLIAILSLLAVYYFNQMRKVEVETKKRISMDLHDETGTILTRVLLMSKSEAMITKNMDIFQSSLKEALFSLRTYMDSLSGKKGDLSDLLVELKEFISTSFRGNRIKPNFIIEKSENVRLSSELYRDIKLCLYEAVQNTLKHGNSNEFDVKIYQKNQCLFLEISDNGATSLMLEELEKKGNGFRNFYKRTKRHNGSVKIELKGEMKSVNLLFIFPLK